MKLAMEADATFDVCPISNVKLDVIDRLEDHPIRKLFDQGIRVHQVRTILFLW